MSRRVRNLTRRLSSKLWKKNVNYEKFKKTAEYSLSEFFLNHPDYEEIPSLEELLKLPRKYYEVKGNLFYDTFFNTPFQTDGCFRIFKLKTSKDTQQDITKAKNPDYITHFGEIWDPLQYEPIPSHEFIVVETNDTTDDDWRTNIRGKRVPIHQIYFLDTPFEGNNFTGFEGNSSIVKKKFHNDKNSWFKVMLPLQRKSESKQEKTLLQATPHIFSFLPQEEETKMTQLQIIKNTVSALQPHLPKNQLKNSIQENIHNYGYNDNPVRIHKKNKNKTQKGRL